MYRITDLFRETHQHVYHFSQSDPPDRTYTGYAVDDEKYAQSTLILFGDDGKTPLVAIIASSEIDTTSTTNTKLQFRVANLYPHGGVIQFQLKIINNNGIREIKQSIGNKTYVIVDGGSYVPSEKRRNQNATESKEDLMNQLHSFQFTCAPQATVNQLCDAFRKLVWKQTCTYEIISNFAAVPACVTDAWKIVYSHAKYASIYPSYRDVPILEFDVDANLSSRNIRIDMDMVKSLDAATIPTTSSLQVNQDQDQFKLNVLAPILATKFLEIRAQEVFFENKVDQEEDGMFHTDGKFAISKDLDKDVQNYLHLFGDNHADRDVFLKKCVSTAYHKAFVQRLAKSNYNMYHVPTKWMDNAEGRRLFLDFVYFGDDYSFAYAP